ncbi:MAG: hypothetical protein JNM85_04395 [Chthonomonas sp.]|nr:hypothetical protein [Chthonomonas sp.]
MWTSGGALACAALFMLCGCGAKPTAPKPEVKPESSATASEPARKVNTGAGAMTQTSPEGKSLWTVKWSTGGVSLDGEGRAAGQFDQVTGSLYQDGTEGSTFSAPKAVADQKAGVLSLSPGVHIKQVGGDLALSADSVRYLDAYQLIEARGNVRIVSKSYNVGPLPAMLATADMRRVGTPDVFKREIETMKQNAMRRNAALPILAVALTTSLAGQAENRVADMAIDNFKSVSRELVSDAMHFTVEGAPRFKGFWRKQNLTVLARRAEGKALAADGGGFELSTATFSGDLDATIVNELATGRRTLAMESERMDYVAGSGESVATLPGKVKITNTLDGAGAKDRSVVLTGSSARVRLAPFGTQTKAPLRGIEISGPVVATMSGQSAEGSRKTQVDASAVDWTEGASESTLVAKGAVTVRSTIDGFQDLTIGGSGATVSMTPLSESSNTALRSMTMRGPVRLTLYEQRKGKDGKVNPLRVDGTSDALVYESLDGGAARITLDGNVRFTGEDSALFGNTRCKKAVVMLNAQGLVGKVELIGEGTSEVTEKPGAKNP